ncbi:hypothetical protein M407DRAFT_32741 [Tulasnella calospora MUT 4182]|uniref:Ubiquitin-like protease family profile domain-containing protein n=1 Tax=Tulasnella calospora MUT 4182 TaxID=1051891 RepID=A0A0C3Q475_9AGAM|nr:hypothetical protein M407DRAFT_32741 [Tulasnella calospora MUT 4182]
MASSVIDYSSDGLDLESDYDGEVLRDDEQACVEAPSPISVDGLDTPPPMGVILRYSGYLDLVHEVTQSDLDALLSGGELNDRAIDVLMAMAHAQIREDQPDTMADTLVLPTSFSGALLDALGERGSITAIAHASQRISQYHEKFWKSKLILIPVQHKRHWILVALANPHLARDRSMVKPPSQVTRRKDIRPDDHPFCILVFNSLQKAWSVAPLIELLKESIRYLWSAICGGVLEHVDSHNVKCPQQLDTVSCGLYIIGFAESLMRAGVSERIRRSAQGVRIIDHAEYDDIFKPSDLSSATFRQMKGSLLQQEADLFACLQELHGQNASSGTFT